MLPSQRMLIPIAVGVAGGFSMELFLSEDGSPPLFMRKPLARHGCQSMRLLELLSLWLSTTDQASSVVSMRCASGSLAASWIASEGVAAVAAVGSGDTP